MHFYIVPFWAEIILDDTRMNFDIKWNKVKQDLFYRLTSLIIHFVTHGAYCIVL